jgi:hypothetical protein
MIKSKFFKDKMNNYFITFDEIYFLSIRLDSEKQGGIQTELHWCFDTPFNCEDDQEITQADFNAQIGEAFHLMFRVIFASRFTIVTEGEIVAIDKQLMLPNKYETLSQNLNFVPILQEEC